MIAKMTIVDAQMLPIDWWHKHKQLKKIKTLDFRPGLNILCGRNGSGKTSILLLLARMFYAEIERFSVINMSSMSTLFPEAGKAKVNRLSSVEILHDGKGITYYDPYKKPIQVPVKTNDIEPKSQIKLPVILGLTSAQAQEHQQSASPIASHIPTTTKSILTRGTSGRDALKELEELTNKLKKRKMPICRLNRDKLEKLQLRRLDMVEEWLKPSIEPGAPTILLDEPDKNLDIPRQRYIWKMMPKMAHENAQLIVASNSMFCLDIPGANYIELSEDYLAECRSNTKLLEHKEIRTEEDKMMHMLAQIETAKKRFETSM